MYFNNCAFGQQVSIKNNWQGTPINVSTSFVGYRVLYPNNFVFGQQFLCYTSVIENRLTRYDSYFPCCISSYAIELLFISAAIALFMQVSLNITEKVRLLTWLLPLLADGLCTLRSGYFGSNSLFILISLKTTN